MVVAALMERELAQVLLMVWGQELERFCSHSRMRSHTQYLNPHQGKGCHH